MSKELFFESQLILNDFDCAAIAGMDQPSVLRLGERGRREGEGEGGRGGERERERGRVGEKVIHYQL